MTLEACLVVFVLSVWIWWRPINSRLTQMKSEG
jgi:hypothetical protein